MPRGLLLLLPLPPLLLIPVFVVVVLLVIFLCVRLLVLVQDCRQKFNILPVEFLQERSCCPCLLQVVVLDLCDLLDEAELVIPCLPQGVVDHIDLVLVLLLRLRGCSLWCFSCCVSVVAAAAAAVSVGAGAAAAPVGAADAASAAVDDVAALV